MLFRRASTLALCQASLALLNLEHPTEWKRQDDSVVSVPIEFRPEWYGHYVPVKIGTPEQTLHLSLGAGELLTWVFDGSSAIVCPLEGCPYGSFILQDSTTANTSVDDLLTGPIRGELFTDKFTLGKTTLDQFEMAFIDSAWGEYHPTLSLCRELPKNEMLAYAMVAQGHTNSAAYSVILSEDTDNTGTLLFGGVDAAKYHGSLMSLVTYDQQQYRNKTWSILLTSVEATSPTGSDIIQLDPSVAVTLSYEKGNSLLPLDIADQIFNMVDAKIDRLGRPTIPCSMNASVGSFTFTFGTMKGASINISMANLVVPNLELEQTKGEEQLCGFLISGTHYTDQSYLGWSFLQSAYVVLDLPNLKVGIAQARHVSESSIKAFEGNNAPIPLATQVPNQPTTAPETVYITSVLPTAYSFSASSGFSILSTTTKSSTASETPTPTNAEDRPSVSGTTIGLAVGIPLAAIFAAAAAAGFLLYRRRKAKRGGGSTNNTTTTTNNNNNNATVSQGGESESTPMRPPIVTQVSEKQVTSDSPTVDHDDGRDQQRLSHTTTIAASPPPLSSSSPLLSSSWSSPRPCVEETIGELESNHTSY